ncbi:hypothetical protein KY362_01360 [Candidatus Woesearchaeota archaeon]|nr:hypothetical protein [Candidatus Woesearchaeota archaeon]
MKGRKAQITVFMIIGIILLFSTSLIFYIRARVVEDVPAEVMEAVEDVPIEAQPVKIYVENCIKQTGRAAIEDLGLHGGYVRPHDPDIALKQFYVGPDPTDSEGITMFDRPETVIPYWWHLKSTNTCSGNCEFESLRPPLRKSGGEYSIEEQIDTYVKAKLPGCLKDFGMFREQGYLFEVGEITPNTRVAADDVSIVVHYPITFSRDGSATDLNRFAARIEVDLEQVYEMASMIVQEQIDKNYLESHTLNMIELNSMPMSMDLLPPVAEFTLNPGEFNFWTRTQTQDQLQKYVLTNAMQQLQVIKSRNYQRVIMLREEDDGTLKYNHLGTRILDSTGIQLEKNFTELAARFEYLPFWPIYLDLNGDEVVMPLSVDQPLLSFMGINEYRTYYSLAYPVMVTISDPEAFLGEGYDFKFAMEHNLRDNEPVNTTSTLVGLDEQGTLVCGEKNKQSAPVTIDVVEEVSGNPIQDVRVSFVFGREGCRIGTTKIVDEQSQIVAQLPVGMGELRAAHQDYADVSIPFMASLTKEKQVTIEMRPYVYMNVTAFARPLNYDTENQKYVMPAGGPHSSLFPYEQYMIIFERLTDQDRDGVDDSDPYRTFGQAWGPEPTTVRLVPGKYHVRAHIIHNKTIIIPEETMEVGGGIFGGSEEVELNETILDQWQIGGAYFNNETGFLDIPYDKLFGSSRLNIYLLRFPPPETHSTQVANKPSLEQAGELEEYSARYRTYLEPQWIE